MARRPPSPPPALAGFDYVRLLGTGGFADVFLYQQQLPRRQVAVKVLLGDRLDAATVDSFTTEANVMAQLATHPSIVSVYHAAIADDGRPYLVMEYCSRPNLQARHRRERFSEAETLRVGVQIAGAVETAHRAGILHRDIKPANILVTEYGRPALTDFGIAATSSTEMAGMSVPWSPPESFRMPPEGDVTSDVYSLAATLYTLLTNRSPFEIPGASNTEIDLVSRIQSTLLPPIGRSDVSASFEAVLAKAMSKRPTDRYARAIEFARALQRVQIELGMQATPIDVVEDEIDTVEEDDDDGRTRFRSVTSIDAQAPLQQTPVHQLPVPVSEGAVGLQHPVPVAFETSSPPAPDATVRRAVPVPAPAPSTPPAAAPVDDTLRRVDAPAAGPVDVPAPRSRAARIVGWSLGGVVVLAAAAVGVAVMVAPHADDVPAKTHSSVAAPEQPVVQTRQIAGLTGKIAGGSAVFTWTDPQPQDGDAYLWRQLVLGEEVPYAKISEPTVTVPLKGAAKVCVEVTLLAPSGDYADPVQACAS